MATEFAVSPAAVWAALALFFFVVEGVVAGSFVALFFGVAALCAAALSAVGLAPALWQQCAWFVVVTAAGALVARKKLRDWASRLDAAHPVAQLAGTTAIAVTALPVGETGMVSMHGTRWSARNVGTTAIAPKQACVVITTHGISLDVSTDLERS